jgi:prolyl-tRNA synthetase
VFVCRRDEGRQARFGQKREEFIGGIAELLESIQNALWQRALTFRDENTHDIDDWETFAKFFTPEDAEKPEIHGGFARAHWCDDVACENKINDDFSVTIRTIPFDRESSGEGACIVCGKPSSGRVVFAKSY